MFRSKPFIIGASVLVAASGMAGYVWMEEHRPAVLEIYVFAVKTGQSIFVRTPDDKRILIDGGGSSEVIRNLTEILPFYSRRIDTVIATNESAKDVTGLVDVLERYKVDKVIVPGSTLEKLGLATSTDPAYVAFLDSAHRLKIPIQEASAGDSIIFSEKTAGNSVGAVTADVLFPSLKDEFEYSKASPPEIILKISYGSTSSFLLGNASTKIQKSITDKKIGNTDVLIIPHSASPDSLFTGLMDDVRPTNLIYSQTIAKSSARKASSKSKKKVADPLYFVLNDKRFNLKEKGTVKIVSDGSVVILK